MNLGVLRATATAALLAIALSPIVGVVAPGESANAAVSNASDLSGTGYDISWPQCDAPFPANPAFGIVGVNAGIVFSPNPCLAGEIAWAGGTRAGLYANTGNPGPALSKHWPAGQTTPRFCDPANLDTAACAYDYGYNAAADSYADAAAAFAALGLPDSPATSAWWLDVETSNSWRSDVSLNVADLQGATDYLASVGVTAIGFYSTQYQWHVITGGTIDFAAHPSWVAGASDAQGAQANCTGTGFTGGGVALTQYVWGGFDRDISCSTPAVADFSLTVSPPSQSIRRGGTATYAVTISTINGFGGPVALSLSGQPSNSIVTFTPNPATSSATLSVRTAPSGGRGTFTMTITGTSGNLSHTATAKLSLTK